MSLPSLKVEINQLQTDDWSNPTASAYIPLFLENWIRRENKRGEPVVELFAVYGDQKVSLPQLRYYWGIVLEDIADQTGLHPDELHDAHKAMFGLKTTYIFEDEVRERIYGLSKMGRRRATQFIDRVINYWTERSVIIREPNSLTRAEMIEALMAEQID